MCVYIPTYEGNTSCDICQHTLSSQTFCLSLSLSLSIYIYIYICIYIYIIKPTRCTKFSNLFWNKTQRVSDGSSLYHQDFSLYTQQWHMSYRFVDSLRAGSGRNCSSVLILLASCQQTCMTCTIAVCTVKNSR